METKKTKAPLKILIIEDRGFPRLNSDDGKSRPTFAFPNEAQLFLITSNLVASGVKKGASKAFAACAEISDIHLNGTMELIATAWHEKFKFDHIYCNDEDLLLRAADLRASFEISTGLHSEQAIAFRDKCVMKTLALGSGVTVPYFSQLRSPARLLSFIRKRGLPVVIKPVCGSSSENIRVLRTTCEVHSFISMEYFKLQAETSQYSGGGGLMVESFVQAPMYHVNGLAEGNTILNMWCFRYIGNNLNFTEGKPYGNISLTQRDSELSALQDTARKTIGALTRDSNARFAFHAEFFLVDNDDKASSNSKKTQGKKSDYSFALCEVAARTPGGSILDLISLLNPLQLPINIESMPANERRAMISKYVFRFVCNLADSSPSPVSPRGAHVPVVADLLVPLRRGYAISRRPSAKEPLPTSVAPHGIDVCYFPTKSAITRRPYAGFDVSVINTAARFLAQMADFDAHPTANPLPTSADFEETLMRAFEWYMSRTRFLDCRDFMESEQNSGAQQQKGVVSARASSPSERLVYVATRNVRRRRHAGMQMVATHGGMYSRSTQRLVAKIGRRMQENYQMSRQMIHVSGTARRAIAAIMADKVRRASGRCTRALTPPPNTRSPSPIRLPPSPLLRPQGSASSIELVT